MKKKFSFRGFISLYITISFLIMTLSGIILYFAPPGRVANWSYWRFLGLLKSDWQSIHTIFTFIFIIATGFHLFFNWKPFIAYLKTKIESKTKLRKELIASSILVILIFVMTINGAIPFKSVMDLGETLKNSWSSESTEPPIPHAEDLSIKEFANNIKISLGEIKNKLAGIGIKIENENITIKELAEQKNISPNEIYKVLKKSGNGINSESQTRGYGRKTLEEICAEGKINIDQALKNLRTEGIEAQADEKLKDIAMRNNLLPVDVANIVLGNKKSVENI